MALIDFLRTRLNKDEQVAKLAAGVPWIAMTTVRWVHVDPAVIRENKPAYGRLGFVATVEHAEDLTHIVRHDPARVVAEVLVTPPLVVQNGVKPSATPPPVSPAHSISLGSTRVGGGDRRDHWAILDTDTALVHPIDDLISIEIVDRKMEA